MEENTGNTGVLSFLGGLFLGAPSPYSPFIDRFFFVILYSLFYLPLFIFTLNHILHIYRVVGGELKNMPCCVAFCVCRRSIVVVSS